MAAKAYLMLRMQVDVMPPAVMGAEISFSPLSSWSIKGVRGWRWVELLHVRGNTHRQAEEKLLDMVRGKEPCQCGDLRFLWPFLDPSVGGHRARYELTRRISSGVVKLSKATGPSAATPMDHPYGGGEGEHNPNW